MVLWFWFFSNTQNRRFSDSEFSDPQNQPLLKYWVKGHIGFSFVLEKHLHHTEEILFLTCKHSTTQIRDLFVHKSKLGKAGWLLWACPNFCEYVLGLLPSSRLQMSFKVCLGKLPSKYLSLCTVCLSIKLPSKFSQSHIGYDPSFFYETN
jgi:hypothetical protein